MTKSGQYSDTETYSWPVHPRKFDRPPLSEAEIARARADAPDDAIKLQSGFSSCRSCGIAVPTPENEENLIQLTASGRMVNNDMAAQTQAAITQRPIPLSFALCDTHRRTQELAEQLISDGNHPIYRERMACALDALSFVDAAQVERVAFIDPEGRETLVRHLGQVGQRARWSAKFTPMIEADADPRTCAPRPWAHLKLGARQELRTAYATLLRERVSRSAPAVPIPPPQVGYLTSEIPIAGGCMFCGVSHQMMPAVVVAREGRENVARDLWIPKRAGTQQLGGERSPHQLSGYLCKPCAEAVSHVGTMGPSALERAVTAALAPDRVGFLGWGHSMNGLVGWGALVARDQQGAPPSQPAPNTKPWQHLGDLKALSEQLGAALS